MGGDVRRTRLKILNEIEEMDNLKKSEKITLLLVLALTLSLGLVASVWAQPMDKGMGHGPAMMNLTPEQAGKIYDLNEKMYADTSNLRKQMMIKHAELAALLKAEKPDQNAIQAKQKELKDLGDQIQEKMVASRLEAKKIAPDFDMSPGPGMGTGMGMCPAAGSPPPPPPPGR
jgi:Spy/CpxP family protein refolding chaperone